MTEPDFVATSDGADQAVRRGNLRRLRSAATTTVAGLAVTGVVVLAPWQGPGSRDSLTPARDPLPTSSATPTPAPTPSATATAISLVAVASPTSTPVPTQMAPVPTAAVAPTRRTAVPAPRSPITRGTSSIATDDLCPQDQADAAQGWCVRYSGPATARRGHPVALRMELCRLGSFPAAAVTFTSGREALLSVSAAGWQAGQGERFSEPGRTVSVAPTTCLTWTSTWDTRDSDGFLVLPGRYAVGVGIESNQLTLASASDFSLEVTD